MINMVKAYVGMGSNIGDGKRTLQDAWKSLGSRAGIDCQQLSSPYLSAPVGMASQNWFTNGVGVLTTTLEPVELLRILLETEADFGRKRPTTALGYQDRSLDLDLLYFGDTVVISKELTLPHPHVSKRLFVLEPLSEVALSFTDHITGLTAKDMIVRLQESFVQDKNEKQEISRSSWAD